VSRRLIAVIVIALVMGVVFGGVQISAAADAATGYARTAQLAVWGEEVTALAQALENERDLTAAVCAASPTGCSGNAFGLSRTVASLYTQMLRAQAVTNAEAARVKPLADAIGGPFPATTQAKAAAVVSMISSLPGLRSALVGQLPQSVIQGYSQAIADLFALNDEITSSSGDAVLAEEVRTLSSMARAMDQASQERAIFYAALIEGSFDGVSGLQELATAQGLETADLLAFESSATASEKNAYLNAVNDETVDTTQLLNDVLSVASVSGSGSIPADPAVAFTAAFYDVRPTDKLLRATATPALWYSLMTVKITRMRSVELQVAGSIVARSQSLKQGARQSEELTVAATVAVLLLVLVLTFIVARSLVRPLRRLQEDALKIAMVQLPARVAALSEATDPNATVEVEPVSVHSTDEIGKVARAFDQVHKEAVRLAGNEALLRGSLNAMFISLSRRSVPLIERLARMIDSLEQNEDDPDRLSNLFSMDHLVTRMRRNSENLLVLAGEEPVRKWSGPVPLTDVARAATSEIEQYTRVVLDIQPGIAVSGQAASDVVHLLAEIIENATTFSPKATMVQVSAQELTGGGVLLEVRDNGVGISLARLDEMNHRLDTPPEIDVSVSRHMGLFAVSRLAARNGVKVRLRTASPEGLSALVWLPGSLAGQEAARHVGPWPRQPASQAPAAQVTVGGRRVPGPGRHRPGLRAAADQQDDTGHGYADSVLVTGIAPAAAPAGGRSEWFRAKRPSSASAQAVTGEAIDSTTRAGTGMDSPGNGGSASGNAWADGWRTAETASAPVRDEYTAAGLPSRVPGANLFSGSAASMTAKAWGTGETSAASPRQPGRGTEEAAQAPPASLPRRSPQQARSRLSGFQLGSRQAEGWTSSEGEGS
jgi:signal transduction histidine kinase